MAFIDWTDDYSVGIAAIDMQHQTLVGFINAVHSLVHSEEVASKDRLIPEIQAVLFDMDLYCQNHFSFEELLFQQHDYPGSLTHGLSHKLLLRKTQTFVDKAKQGDAEILPELLDFLKSWLTQHILIEDMKYAEFFRGKNVQV